MNIKHLESRHRELGREMRAVYKSISKDTPESEAAKAEMKFHALQVERDELADQIEEQRASAPDPRRPSLDGTARGVDIRDDDHLRAFSNWLRAPNAETTRSALSRFETRDASGLTGSAGGFLVPEQIVTPIAARARDVNPFRDIVRVVRVSTGDVKFPVTNADATSGWVGETDTRTATAEPTLAEKAPTFGTAYANVIVTEELAMDAVVDVVDWFSFEAGRAMGEAEMTAIVSGNGTNRPTGLLNTAPESAADGSRTADALKYIASGAAATLGTAPAELLMDVYYDLKSAYRSNATWVMNSSTAAAVRKLKNGSDDFVWAESLAAGQPARLLGHPVVIAEAMPDIGADAHPILFGDFSAGYVLCPRTDMIVLPDPYSTKGQIQVYVRYRVGGTVLDENAIRAVKVAST